ncbi:HNH endonuclease [Arthrobacter phage Sarge]|uniref:HNH endonuclease n=2 Tax=Caudoviricetes TaxID=2731619 RepID=A0AAE8Y9W6_9CAUD|nr:HNH endonuclease [Arthrobacter phage Sarge]YP_010649665.1 HNH endonuclease [Arthrobacter phage Shoya]QIG57716.1 HNH endonuclease [Arthrobacter phage Shoya]UDL14886.1 HNH endonuclease [Arthrobacter phage Sarge]
MSEWRAIPGYEGHYEVSDDGQIRSLPRLNARNQPIGGHILKPNVETDGYQRVDLFMRGARSHVAVHRMVMLAFEGPCPEGQEVLHGDGNRVHNRLPNLSYGTRSENALDTIRHGMNVNAAKTHCKRGHEFTADNTHLNVNGSRECRRCTAIRRQRRREARVPA